MRVLIAGATGNTGRRICEKLASIGDIPVALVRESSDRSGLPEATEFRQSDLADLKGDEAEGVDTVIFAAGSGGDTDAEMTDRIDRDGAKRLIDITAKAGVDRFVMLSSIGADDPDAAEKQELRHYLDAKHAADVHLKQSGLTYSIIRPVTLTEEDGEGKILLGDGVDRSAKAHRGDVATVLVRALVDEELKNVATDMQSC